MLGKKILASAFAGLSLCVAVVPTSQAYGGFVVLADSDTGSDVVTALVSQKVGAPEVEAVVNCCKFMLEDEEMAKLGMNFIYGESNPEVVSEKVEKVCSDYELFCKELKSEMKKDKKLQERVSSFSNLVRSFGKDEEIGKTNKKPVRRNTMGWGIGR